MKLARISTFDRIDGVEIGTVLEGNTSVDINAFRGFMEGRIA